MLSRGANDYYSLFIFGGAIGGVFQGWAGLTVVKVVGVVGAISFLSLWWGSKRSKGWWGLSGLEGGGV